MTPSIRIIQTSSLGGYTKLRETITRWDDLGINVKWRPHEADAFVPFLAGSSEERLKALVNALLEEDTDVVLCQRGGYGASELLPHLPWEKLAQAKPKPIVGFSDVSSILSALHTLLKWPVVHGPMPGTSIWGESLGAPDIWLLTEAFILKNSPYQLSIDLVPIHAPERLYTGFLFGGNLAVLSALIGTPYLPKKFFDHFLFFEDIAENPGRILRCLQQWSQAGLFEGISGLILGNFAELGDQMSSQDLKREIARRFKLPTWSTEEIGHVALNWPIEIGVRATIQGGRLMAPAIPTL